MEPATAAMLVKGVEVGAPIVGAGISAASQYFTNKWNANLSRENRRWQERMSNTAHQREMKDLAAAGLNPLLTGKYGGASTPGGSNATMQNPGAGFEQAGQAVSSALMQQKLNKAQIDNINAQTNKTVAESVAIEQDIEQKGKTNPLMVNKLIEEIDSLFVHSSLAESQKFKAEKEIEALGHKMFELNARGALWREASNRLSPAGAALAAEIIEASKGAISMGALLKILNSFKNGSHWKYTGRPDGSDDYNIVNNRR